MTKRHCFIIKLFMTTHDKEIIEALERNREIGFRMLLAKYQEPIYWHIRRLVVSHEDAQDASQETFVRLFRSLDQYRGDCSFRSWIYRIATNEALRLIGKRRQEEVSIDSASRMFASIWAKKPSGVVYGMRLPIWLKSKSVSISLFVCVNILDDFLFGRMIAGLDACGC